MKKNLSPLLALTLTACGLGASMPAQAQSVDYGSLQSLFGEPITTSATGTPQLASDVAADMTIITADQIRQSGARDIAGVLERVPGLELMRTGSTAYDVGIGGYTQPMQHNLLVLVDGRQVFNDDYSRTDWFNLPVNIDDIRQIEVVQGAASALFGSNASGGVINIITYSPFYDDNNVAAVTMGTQHRLQGDATVTAKLGNYGGVKITAGGLNQDEFSGDLNNAGYEPQKRYATASSLFEVNSNVKVSSEFTYSETRNNEALPPGSTSADHTITTSAKGGVDWQTPIGLISDITYFNHAVTQFYSSGSTSASPVFSDDLFVEKLTDQFKIGSDNTVRLAGEYRYKEFHPKASGGATPQIDENVFTAGGTWLWNISNQWSWTNALSVEHYNLEQTGTLPASNYYQYNNFSHDMNGIAANSGLVYKPTDQDSFRLTYGRGIQDPSMSQYGLVISGGGFDLTGNPYLKPTIVQNYELGYDRKLPFMVSTAKFSTHYQTTQGLSEAVAMTGPVTEPINVGNSDAYGGKVQLVGSTPSGFRWDESYTFSRVTDSPSAASALDTQGSFPQHHIRLSGGYTTGPWEFDAMGEYISALDMMGSILNPVPVHVAGYIATSGRIGYQINDEYTVALSGTNLNKAYTTESSYPQVERQIFLTVTGKF
ncbi:MAG: TonB-dependent receptor [Alphaproteobacteria bacterium]|nr:TonB-dependent receptor [Alphaproteobacteria bacterium]